MAEDSSTNTEPIDKNHPELTAYKDLISDTLQETSDSDLRVARINLDNDDIYELAMFEGDAHNQGAYLYTYKNGNVISLNNDDFPFYGQYGGFSYNPKNKKLYYDYDSANKYVEFYFTFENASLNLDYFLSHDINSDDVDNIEEHFYYVNNDIDYALSISLPLAKDEDDTENVPESDDVIYINYTGNHLSHEDIQKIYDDTCYSYEFEYMGGGYSAAEALSILQ